MKASMKLRYLYMYRFHGFMVSWSQDVTPTQRITRAVAPVSSLGQLARNGSSVPPEHRNILPAHHLQDVAVVHPEALHLRGGRSAERVDAFVTDLSPSAHAADGLEDPRTGERTFLAAPEWAVGDAPTPRVSLDRLERSGAEEHLSDPCLALDADCAALPLRQPHRDQLPIPDSRVEEHSRPPEEVIQEQVRDIGDLLESGQRPEALIRLAQLHPADQGEVLDGLSREFQQSLLVGLDHAAVAEILEYLEPDVSAEMVGGREPADLAQVLSAWGQCP